MGCPVLLQGNLTDVVIERGSPALASLPLSPWGSPSWAAAVRCSPRGADVPEGGPASGACPAVLLPVQFGSVQSLSHVRLFATP